MSPALLKHLTETIEKTHGKLVPELEQIAADQLSSKQYVDEIARQNAISSRALTTGAYRIARAQKGQKGILTTGDLDVLRLQFEELTKPEVGFLRKQSRVSGKLVGIQNLTELEPEQRKKLALKLLGIGSFNISTYPNLIAGVEDLITKSTLENVYENFVKYLDGLNAQAISVFQTPKLADTFMTWYSEQPAIVRKGGRLAGSSAISGKEKSLAESEQALETVREAGPVSIFGSMASVLGTSTTTKKPKKQKSEPLLTEDQHGALNQRFKQYVISKLNRPPAVAEYISLNTDAGHVMGLFNIRLLRLFDIKTVDIKDKNGKIISASEINIDQSGNIPQITITLNPSRIVGNDPQALIDLQNFSKLLTGVFQQLSNIDFLTSSYIASQDGVQAYLAAVKENFTRLGGEGDTAYATYSVQISWLNQEAGRQIADAGKALSNLIRELQTSGAKAGPAIQNFAKSFNGLQDYARKVQDTIASSKLQGVVNQVILDELNKNSTETAQLLSDVSGSDTMKEAFVNSIISIITGQPYKGERTVLQGKNVKLPAPKNAKPRQKVKVTKPNVANNQKTVDAIKKTVATTKKVIAKAKQDNRNKKIGFSLTNLQSILNGILFEQIKKNMGTGSRYDVLNFRTGRFASSAKIERMSESREGMITAFYSYMKNPYATFSRGGRQERPFTRDPKLLISKSIRELAQPYVANRMRAVLV